MCVLSIMTLFQTKATPDVWRVDDSLSLQTLITPVSTLVHCHPVQPESFWVWIPDMVKASTAAEKFVLTHRIILQR